MAPSSAWAACDTANSFSFDWNSQPQTFLSYGTTTNYTAANTAGATRGFSVNVVQDGMAATTVAGYQMPLIGPANEATTGAGQYTLTFGGRFSARTSSMTGATRVATATLTFASAVRDLTFRVHDIDFRANEYRDWVRIVGRNGANSYFPTVARPPASTVKLGPSTTAPTLATGELLGTSESQVNQDVGTVTVSFAQPVTSVEIRYGNYPLQSGEKATGEQWISIYDLAFCPMPNVSVAKTSAPWSSTGPARFNTPGSDIVYTLTVANSGGSPVDLSSLALVDLLPPGISFYNGDFDPAAPGTDPFQFVPNASGVSLAASNVSYSSNGGSSYGYTPSAGYDAAVSALRFAPAGSMAANSSFSISFRARIK